MRVARILECGKSSRPLTETACCRCRSPHFPIRSYRVSQAQGNLQKSSLSKAKNLGQFRSSYHSLATGQPMSMKRKASEESAGPSAKRTVDFFQSKDDSRQQEIQPNIPLGPASSPTSSTGAGDDGSVFSADFFVPLDSSPFTFAPTQTQTAATSVASATTRTAKKFPSDLKRLQCPIGSMPPFQTRHRVEGGWIDAR